MLSKKSIEILPDNVQMKTRNSIKFKTITNAPQRRSKSPIKNAAHGVSKNHKSKNVDKQKKNPPEYSAKSDVSDNNNVQSKKHTPRYTPTKKSFNDDLPRNENPSNSFSSSEFTSSDDFLHNNPFLNKLRNSSAPIQQGRHSPSVYSTAALKSFFPKKVK